MPEDAQATTWTAQAGAILLGTTDGLLAASSTNDTCWRDGGFDGVAIGAILADEERWLVGSRTPASGEPLLESEDMGATVRTVKPDVGPIFTFARKPTDPDFLVAAGFSFRFHWSTDGGRTWTSGGRAICPPCRIAIPAGDPDALYAGCTCPLGSFFLARYDMSDIEELPLGIPSPEKRVENPLLDNRRITVIRERPDGSNLLVGVPDGLVELTPGERPSTRWIWRRDAGDPAAPPLHLRLVWVDPCTPHHIVFGGVMENSSCSVAMFETHDDGATVSPLAPPRGIDWCDTWLLDDAGPVGSKGQHVLLPVTIPSPVSPSFHTYLWSGSECPDH